MVHTFSAVFFLLFFFGSSGLGGFTGGVFVLSEALTVAVVLLRSAPCFLRRAPPQAATSTSRRTSAVPRITQVRESSGSGPKSIPNSSWRKCSPEDTSWRRRFDIKLACSDTTPPQLDAILPRHVLSLFLSLYLARALTLSQSRVHTLNQSRTRTLSCSDCCFRFSLKTASQRNLQPSLLHKLNVMHNQALRICSGSVKTSTVAAIEVRWGKCPCSYEENSLPWCIGVTLWGMIIATLSSQSLETARSERMKCFGWTIKQISWGYEIRWP